MNKKVTVQPSGFTVTESAHLKFGCAKGRIPTWHNIRILTDFAASAKSWAELLHKKGSAVFYRQSFLHIFFQ